MVNDEAASREVTNPVRRAVKFTAITLGVIATCVGGAVVCDPFEDVHESFACDGLHYHYRFSDSPITRAPRAGIVGAATCTYRWEFDQIHTTRTVAFRTRLDPPSMRRQVEAFCRREGFGAPTGDARGLACDKRGVMFSLAFDERDPHEVTYNEMLHTM